MRIIAELPHPDCKITIFLMNQKYLIKFEKGNYEQTYKLSELDIIDGINGIFKLVDDEFIKKVKERFAQMRDDFSSAYKRYDGC